MPLATQHGGAERALLHLLTHRQQDQPIDCAVAFLEDGPLVNQARRLNAEARVFSAGRLRHPGAYIRTIRGIARWAREINASTLVGWMGKAQLYSGAAACLAGRPGVWFQHGIPSGMIDKFAAWMPARGILTCSRYVAELQSQVSPRRPLRVVYPGVDLDNFDLTQLPSPHAARELLNIPMDGSLIGFVGRLQRWKGVHVLLRAMEQVWQQQPEARCVIVGGPHVLEQTYAEEIARFAAAVSQPHRVHLVGGQHNVPIWMQAMDVVVHASFKEPFGMVVPEAMALAKPVIASVPGGPKEVIEHGVTGWLCPSGDADSLAAGISALLANPQLAHRIGMAAQVRAQKFSASDFADGVVTACSELITGKFSARNPILMPMRGVVGSN
jgi:glycosyltransferase involved in cell wall biosynthesis